jgi:hypothetical protein
VRSIKLLQAQIAVGHCGDGIQLPQWARRSADSRQTDCRIMETLEVKAQLRVVEVNALYCDRT